MVNAVLGAGAQWFAGWFGQGPDEGASAWPPQGGNHLWRGVASRLTAFGAWPSWELCAVGVDAGRVAIFGPCFARKGDIRDRLAQALHGERYEWLAEFPGSYVTVVEQGATSVIVTDLAGQIPVFLSFLGGGAAFSSLAEPLASVQDAEVSYAWLAAYMLLSDTPCATGDAAPYIGLRRIPAGTVVGIRDGVVRWSRPRRLDCPRERHVSDVSECMETALRKAVRARTEVADQPTADLSGGLDSTSLAFLASRELGDRLPTFTYHNPVAPAGDDLAYAQQAVAACTRFDHRLVTGGEDAFTYRNLGEAPVSDEPDAGVVSHVRDSLVFDAVADAGSDLHITGRAGDVLTSAPLAYIADLARLGRWRRFFGEAVGLARLRQRSPTAVAGHAWRATDTALPKALRSLARQIRWPSTAPTEGVERHVGWWTPPGSEAEWFTPGLRERAAATLEEEAAITEVPDQWGIADYLSVCELRAYAAGHRLTRAAAAARGVNMHAPFLDDDVIRACLSVPAYQRADMRMAKPILASAMAGIVPAAVFRRRTKGSHNAEEYLGIRAERGFLSSLFRSEPLVSEYGLVRAPKVRAALHQADMGLRIPFDALNRILAVEVWLRHRHGLPLPISARGTR